MTIEKLLTPEEVAEILSLNIMTIYRYIKQGKLKALKVGTSQYRVKESVLKAFLEDKQN